MKLTFFGGTGMVTGANFLVEDNGFNFLVDCGLVQGTKIADTLNREVFPYNPSSVQVLLVTHAHIDHIGRIPKLVKDGFSGTIISTPETKEIAELLLEDALGILEDEARHDGVLPIYDKDDLAKAISLWQTSPYEEKKDIGGGFVAVYRDSGHILGSGIIELYKNGKKLVFTGDLGNSPSLLLRDTEEIVDADYMIMESVYGDRNHESKDERRAKLKDAIEETIRTNATLIIPAFSLERTQNILYEMNEFFETDGVRNIPVFVDSPLATKITKVYEKYSNSLKESVRDQISAGDNVFDFPKLKFTVFSGDSVKIESTQNPKIILAGSGMSNGGRVINHERQHLPDPNAIILMVGYQSVGTLGRQIQDGAKEVNIYGKKVEVKARIKTIEGYSSHKDSDNLLAFAEKAGESGKLKKIFVVMGEPKSSLFLVQKIKDNLGMDATYPEYGQSFELEI
jgi:metallo-beta-lactamase family protein